ncbi:alkaline phosphatase family protein [Polyangium spumosum]|uniref:phospholipase C n=1 Tax=Polyangium spumosum TaxID=889282 RepID=A0A6N7PY48_9BACT|nr:alkaline phosphatase family protein [Polyangium spumosum]MRG95390.1 phosphoesterase [Polyangium spumosum]
MARRNSSRGPSGQVSRRVALQGLGAGIGAAALGGGCAPGPDRCETGPASPDVVPDFDAHGAPTAKRLLAGIDTFVVLMLENRSFDHFFGALALDPDYPARDAVDGLLGDETNEDDEGNVIAMHRPEVACEHHGPLHSWDAAHQAFAEGKNDGFVRANIGSALRQSDAMTYHDRSQIPLFYALADQYVVCDRWFSSVLGPTWPNRFFLHAATSNGLTTNDPITDGPATLWEKLGKGCWSAKAYTAGPALWYHAGFRGRPLGGNEPMVSARIEAFFQEARAGNLPNFCLIDPDFWSSDLHPPHSLALGEALLGSIVRSMQESPQWGRSLLLVTFDEYGGFYDHVPPPTTVDPRPAFRQLGFRVPSLVIGPSVRRGEVVSTVLEHVSIASTLATRFGIESLGPRMDATADLSSCIDPARVGFPPGPMGKLPRIELDRRRVEAVSFRFTSQPGIDAAIRAGAIGLDRIDTRSHEERLGSLLRHAEELEVARVHG